MTGVVTARQAGLRRPLGLVLALALALQGCGSTSVQEHRARGAPESIAFKPTWRDAQGERHLVGGIRCAVLRGGAVVAEGTTDGRAPLLLEPIAPGRYAVVVSGPGVPPVRRDVEVKARRRLTVRVDVEAASTGGPPSSDDAAYVLEVVGTVVLCIALLGLILVIEGALDGDCGCAGCDDPCRCPSCRDDETCWCNGHACRAPTDAAERERFDAAARDR